MRSNGLSVKFIGLTSLFSQRQHSTPLQSMVKELPAFLRPCRVHLFHLGTIAALEPERQAGRIALTVVFRVQHPLTVGTVLNSPVFFERESKIPLAAFYLFEVPILIGIHKAILEYSFSKNFEK